MAVGSRLGVRGALPVVLLAGLHSPLPADTVVGDKIPGLAFRQYFTGDEFNRRIGFYLSEPEAAATDLPLIVFIQGAGCSSHFKGANGRVWKGIPNLLHDVVRNRARVLAVEKPGVDFLDDRDDESMQESCRPQFFQEHMLERWTAAIAAAVRAARESPFVSDSRTLAVGFSEGALAAISISTRLTLSSRLFIQSLR